MAGRWHMLIGIVLLVVILVAFWLFWPDAPEQAENHTASEPSPTPPVDPPPRTPPTPAAAPEAAGNGAFENAMKLRAAGRIIEARAAISQALFSGRLDRDTEAAARQVAEELASQTILSARVWADDPYCGYYVVKHGDRLGQIVKDLKLRVPYQMLMRVNGIDDARSISASRRLKIIRGPFHAVVTKSTYTLDLHLQPQGQPKVFVRRFGVGLGKNGSTPTGMWRVAGGEKLIRPVWYPPPNSPKRGPVGYGDPGYAFGAKGLWIGLEGIDENTRALTDYGIHSTNEPQSIGRSRSEGCIRLGDEEIEFLFAALYEKYSTVQVRP